MRYILFIAAFFCSSVAYGQGAWSPAATYNIWKGSKADSISIVPRDTIARNTALLSSTGQPVGDYGRIQAKHGLLYFHDSIRNRRVALYDDIPVVSGFITDGENGLVKVGTKLRLGTNPLLANTTLPLTGYSLTLTGNGSASSTESNPFYLFNITDNRTGPTSAAIRNTNALGIGTFAIFNDKSAGVIGINGSGVPPSVDNGSMLPNHFYFDAGLMTRGIVMQLPSTDSANYILKDHGDTLQYFRRTYNSFYHPISVGGLFDLPQNRAADYEQPYMFESIGTDGTKGQWAITQYSNDQGGVSTHSRKARGTQLNPTAILAIDRMYSLGARGYDGTQFAQSSGAILITAEENFTPTANGTSMEFQVTPLGAFGGSRVTGIKLNPDGKAKMNSRVSINDYLLGGASATSYVEFMDKDSVRQGYVGNASAANFHIYMHSDLGHVILQPSAGRVGIRTSSPTDTLDVNGSVQVRGKLGFSGDEWVQRYRSDLSGFEISRNGGEIFIRNSGLVGINTTTANSTLHTNGSFAGKATTITGTTTLDETHYNVDANNSSNIIVNLPAISTCIGREYTISKASNNGNTVTITANGAETINGINTNVLGAQYNSITIWNTGVEWRIK